MSDNIKSLDEKPVPSRRQSRSVFWPIVLIGGGVLLLLSNIGMVSGLNWAAAWRLWPLLLIFIGLDVIVQQVSPPTGTLLSGLVALAAVTVFGFALFTGNTLWGSAVPERANELRIETFELPAAGVESAEITLDLGNPAAEVHPLQGNNNLIDGSIYTSGDLKFETDIDDGRAGVVVGEDNVSWFFNPELWFSDEPGQTWQFNLNTSIPTELRIDVGNGSTVAELGELSLTGLRVNGGNGSLRAVLPPGDYEAVIDSGNGSMRFSLPDSGQQTMNVESGNGSISLFLPTTMEARIEFDEGNGSINVDGSRYSLVSGDRENGVYETANYDTATDRITLEVDSGNGSVSILEP